MIDIKSCCILLFICLPILICIYVVKLQGHWQADFPLGWDPNMTPVKTSHTILHGCCKYMLKSLMSGMSSGNKEEKLAHMRSLTNLYMLLRFVLLLLNMHKALDMSIDLCIIWCYKGWMQMVLFLMWPYLLADAKKTTWLGYLHQKHYLYY